MTNLFNDAGILVFEKEVTPLFVTQPAFGLRKNMCGIAPDEVRGITVRNDDA
jgi:hypothetical protein